MPTIFVCPVCHSETNRLVYCSSYRREVCPELCALTATEMMFLELISTNETSSGQPAPLLQSSPYNSVGDYRI